MKVTAGVFSVLLLFFVGSCHGQCPSTADGCDHVVPHLMKFDGTLHGAAIHPGTEKIGIMFSIYRESSGGAPLWQETQNVILDQHGHFHAVLGITTSDGVPTDIFIGGESRWLGFQALLPGEVEQPRVLLVSVPYAIKAVDAETVGGLPASAFLKAPAASGVNAPKGNTSTATPSRQTSATGLVMGKASTTSTDRPVTTQGGIPTIIPSFSTSTSVINSQIADSNGVVTMKNLANILFADQFSGGVPDAVTACPASGCTIYAASPTVNLNLGTIDPGSKVITIYLGPFTYTVQQITLRFGLKIIGMGASGKGTVVQSVNGEKPVFVIPQTNNVPATNVLLSGFRLLGSVNNKGEDAFFLDASSLVNAGLWFSKFEDVYIENFGGVGIHLIAPSNNFLASNQWLLFDNVIIFRPVGGGNGIRIEGANFELHFTGCGVDGAAVGNGTNIYIGGLPGGNDAFPFIITFRGLLSERAALGVQLDGAQSVAFYTSHHEALLNGYQITNNTNSNSGTKGITIADSSFFSNVGVNNGTGFLLNVATTAASGIRFVHNQIYGTPDSVVSGTNLSQIVYQDNVYVGPVNGPPTSGITTQLDPAATINIGGAHSVGLNPSTTPITAIQSSLGPGEMVTLFTVSGSATFAAGGNISLMGINTLLVNGSITLIRNDLLGNLQWIPVSQWTPGIGTAPSLGLGVAPGGSTTVTVTAGSTATYELMLGRQGMSGTATFTCTGAPPGATCTTPVSESFNAATMTAFNVNVATTARTMGVLHPSVFEPSSLLWALGLMGLVILPRTETVGLSARCGTALVSLLLLVFLCSCGEPGYSQNTHGTPAGLYTLTIAASSGSTSQTQILFLAVQ